MKHEKKHNMFVPYLLAFGLLIFSSFFTIVILTSRSSTVDNSKAATAGTNVACEKTDFYVHFWENEPGFNKNPEYLQARTFAVGQSNSSTDKAPFVEKKVNNSEFTYGSEDKDKGGDVLSFKTVPRKISGRITDAAGHYGNFLLRLEFNENPDFTGWSSDKIIDTKANQNAYAEDWTTQNLLIPQANAAAAKILNSAKGSMKIFVKCVGSGQIRTMVVKWNAPVLADELIPITTTKKISATSGKPQSSSTLTPTKPVQTTVPATPVPLARDVILSNVGDIELDTSSESSLSSSVTALIAVSYERKVTPVKDDLYNDNGKTKDYPLLYTGNSVCRDGVVNHVVNGRSNCTEGSSMTEISQNYLERAGMTTNIIDVSSQSKGEAVETVYRKVMSAIDDKHLSILQLKYAATSTRFIVVYGYKTNDQGLIKGLFVKDPIQKSLSKAEVIQTSNVLGASDIELIDLESANVIPQSLMIVQSQTSVPDSITFVETGKTLKGKFLDYWRKNGGIEIFGYPINDQGEEVSQFTEKSRFELHPELSGSENEILLGLLGKEATKDNLNSNFKVAELKPEYRYFSETGHNVSQKFNNFWQAKGGLRIFGYPISEEFYEASKTDGKIYLVQYFERARFEYHPLNDGTKYEILLGLLGNEKNETFKASKITSQIGVSHIAGVYPQKGSSFLASGAQDIYNLGFRTIEIGIGPQICIPDTAHPAGFYQTSEFCKSKSLKEFIQHQRFKEVLDFPFETIIVTSDPFSSSVASPFSLYRTSDGFSKQKLDSLYIEFKEYTEAILNNYKDSKKTIIIMTPNELDWHMLGNNTNADAIPEKYSIENAIAYLNTVQKAIDDAKISVPTTQLKLYHGCEINLVAKAMKYGENDPKGSSAVRDVLPKTNCDLYGYSAYDTIYSSDSTLFSKAIQYIKTKAPDKAPFGNDNVFISEFGIPENNKNIIENQAKGENLLSKQMENAFKEKVPYFMYWQIYDNNCNKTLPANSDCTGFWLRRPDKTISYIYQNIFRKYLQ